jgi:hypothetical protein
VALDIYARALPAAICSAAGVIANATHRAEVTAGARVDSSASRIEARTRRSRVAISRARTALGALGA